MRKNYVAPQIEVIEIEVEDTLCLSVGGSGGLEGAGSGTTMGSAINDILRII